MSSHQSPVFWGLDGRFRLGTNSNSPAKRAESSGQSGITDNLVCYRLPADAKCCRTNRRRVVKVAQVSALSCVDCCQGLFPGIFRVERCEMVLPKGAGGSCRLGATSVGCERFSRRSRSLRAGAIQRPEAISQRQRITFQQQVAIVDRQASLRSMQHGVGEASVVRPRRQTERTLRQTSRAKPVPVVTRLIKFKG